MRHLRSTAAFGAFLAAAALFAGGAVKAQQTPVFDVVTPNGGNFTWSYNLDVSPTALMKSGDYFTIYDFNGYVAGSAFAPANWSINDTLTTTPPPPGVTLFPADNPSVINLTFTYTGPDTIGSAFFGGVDAFGADSTFGKANLGGVFAYDNHPVGGGRIRTGSGGVVIPSAVPETSSLMLLLPGLVPFGIMLRRRARK